MLACSFTRAAAIEIAEREVPLEKHMRGTLHSICWRAFDQPKLAETAAAEFNEHHPHLRVSGGAQNVDEGLDQPVYSTPADRHAAAYHLFRTKRIPREAWPESVLGFARAWEDWKEQTGFWDFTDLLERALADLPAAPGSPRVIFVDEAQDLSRLQFELIRSWGERTEFFVLVGDDDQTIFSHAGADVQNMLGRDIPEENIRILKQSHRIPSAVHAYSQEWISKCVSRQPKEFQPRDETGLVERLDCCWADPEMLVRQIEQRPDETHMILGTCGYMLNECLKFMRNTGIPFHNPYRRTRGDWNPVSRADGSTFNRIAMFLNCGDELSPRWTMHQLNSWLELVDAKGLLKHGAKKEIADIAATQPALVDPDWRRWFVAGDPFGMDPLTIDWLTAHARASKIKAMDYPLRVIGRYGTRPPEPKVVVGTVHSVKGGESDNVYLFPDLSPQGWNEWKSGGEHRDSVIRTFYVGMTRARKRLFVCRGAGPTAAPIEPR